MAHPSSRRTPTAAASASAFSPDARSLSSSPVPLSLEPLLGQQQIADTLHRMQLIPRAIRVAEAHWQPRMAG
jgi:hypothetical protein